MLGLSVSDEAMFQPSIKQENKNLYISELLTSLQLLTFDLSSCSHAFWLLYKSLDVCLSANLPLMCFLKLSLCFSSIFTLFFAVSCFNASFTSLCLFKSISRPRPPRSIKDGITDHFLFLWCGFNSDVSWSHAIQVQSKAKK